MTPGFQTNSLAYLVPILAGITYVVRLKLSSATLPSRVATHFNLQGAPNGWMSKLVFIIFSISLLWITIIGGILVVRYAMVPQDSSMTLMLIFGATVGLQEGAYISVINAAGKGREFSMRPVFTSAFVVGFATWLTARIFA